MRRQGDVPVYVNLNRWHLIGPWIANRTLCGHTVPRDSIVRGAQPADSELCRTCKMIRDRGVR